MSIVTQIVDRQHVSLPVHRVLRAVIDRLRGGKETWSALDRETRREIAREVADRHNHNKQVYVYVMTGFPVRSEA
jgi:hypothetical protein